GTDRSWPKRRPRPRGRETPRRQDQRGAGFLGAKQGQVKPLLLDLLVDVDFDRTGKEGAPGLQIGLHTRVARHALAVAFDNLVGFVFDFLNEPRRIVDVLQQAYVPTAERLVERRRRLQQRR